MDETIIAKLVEVAVEHGYGVTSGDAERILAALRADGFDITAPPV
jgi:hypothetical protein